MCTICTRLALPLTVQELPQLYGTSQLQHMQIGHKICTFLNFPFHFHCRVVTDSDAVY